MALRVVQRGDEEREVRAALDARGLHRACARGGLRRGLVEWGRRGGGYAPRFFDILGAGSTFARASEGSYYTQAPTDDEGDVAGKAFLAWAVANTPRIDSRDGTPMLLLEGARTNYHTTSRDLGSYTDVGTPSKTDNTTGAPDGDATSRRVDLLNGEAHYKGTVGLTAAAPYIYSQWQRGIAGQTDPMVARIGLNATDQAESSSPPSTTWRRSVLTGSPTGTGQNEMAQEGRATNTLGPSGIAAGDRDGMFAMPQVEGGAVASAAFASSFIRTAGAAATRSADVLSCAAGTWPYSMTREGFSFEWRPIFSSAEAVASAGAFTLAGIAGGVVDGVRGLQSGVNFLLEIRSNSVSVISQAITFSRDQAMRITVNPLAGTLTIEGATTGNGTYSAAEFSTRWSGQHAASVLYVGARSGTSEQCFSRISRSWRLL